jgi:MFS family permease
LKATHKILSIIVISQFFCTSLWFAGNGIMNNLSITFSLPESALGNLTSAVQFGFITGTFLFALFTIVDRFSPSRVFFASAILGALFNGCLILEYQSIQTLVIYRFFTGFFLAGIYPVGMKIATDYFKKGLGKSLGFLVGALVLGTALPHLLKDVLVHFSWRSVIITTSALSCLGGLLMLFFVKDGPYRSPGKGLDMSICFTIFRNKKFRKSAFGYFGHMWELYTFWAFIPILLETYQRYNPSIQINISLFSFFIIAVGSISCVISGYLSQYFSVRNSAFSFLLLSGICCLLCPLLILTSNLYLFVSFLFFWGFVVIADSPLFSTLVAQNSNSKEKGTALTIVNCIGFLITILSIQSFNYMRTITDSNVIFMWLAIGPVVGLVASIKKENVIH